MVLNTIVEIIIFHIFTTPKHEYNEIQKQIFNNNAGVQKW